MTQATDKEQKILDQIRNLTPRQQQEVLDFIEFLQFKARKPELEVEKKEPISAYEAAKEFAGCVDGGSGDLSTNKKYLGRERSQFGYSSAKSRQKTLEISLLSESSLQKDWLRPEEDEAWQDL